MLLKEVRKKGKHKKLLFKVLIEKDSFVVSIKCRGCKEPILIDMVAIIGPYVSKATMMRIRAICNSIYEQRKEEIK